MTAEAAPRSASTWPDAVWSVAVLRGLDARGRADIEAAGTLRDAKRGEAIFRAGEPADAFFVVVRGMFEVRALRRGDREASVLRRVGPGGTLGEEATLRAGATRTTEAFSVERGRLAAIPALVLHRAAGRAGAGELAERIARTLRRAATLDLLRTMSVARDFADADLDALVDAAEHRTLARGEVLYRTGDPATHVYFVADGMLQVQSEEDDRLRVRAYLSRGDVVGELEAQHRRPRDLGVAASGPSWVLAVPREPFFAIAQRYPGLVDRIARLRDAKEDRQAAVAQAAHTTHHVLKDLYRLSVARSLLVIDQDACVRCGHCAWSCAGAHDDGVSRLTRRGDKVVAPTEGGGRASLLLPNSCQHCEHPACMMDCPTGAIGRDPRGEVFIREDLCIGCGNCAKGCPWDNIQMAPRATGGIFAGLLATPRSRPSISAELSPEVAVKCDLCHGRDGGPACVSACPVEAIARVKPDDVVPGLTSPRDRPRAPKLFARSVPAWPWVVGAALASSSIAVVGLGSRTLSGAAATLLVLALAGYVGVKRFSGVKQRPWFVAHLALGLVVMGAVVAHAGLRVPPNLAGALALTFWGTALAGALGGLAYRSIPARLARVERTGALAEDLCMRASELDAQAFYALTGRSELVKTIFARILRPYARARLGAVLLVASGRSLREEQARLTARIARALAGKGDDKLAGLDDLVRLVVERRALGAQRLLQGALRVWMPAHLVGTAALLVLLALHVTFELVYR
jgi:Fe-S-cluster-containing dehydrogenase component/CRP-like cAMP-binding protein